MAWRATYCDPRWLKEPFSIGYHNPNSLVQYLQKALDLVLFGATSPGNVSDVSRTLKINPQVLENQRYLQGTFEPAPQKLTGQQLFNAQYDYLGAIRRGAWKDLDPAFKQVFHRQDYIEKSYTSSLRLWKGYETVRFLKRFLDCKFNPYLYVPLKPVEIIMDKLSVKYKLKPHKSSIERYGDSDYYDILIKQALLKYTKGRSIHQTLFTELKPDDFSGVPMSQVLNYDFGNKKSYYHQKTINRKCHRFWLSLQPTPIPNTYRNYLKKSGVKGQPITKMDPEIRAKWDSMTAEEKSQYQLTSSSARRINGFNKLEWQAALVLHYLYEVGYVDTHEDWRPQMDFKYYTNGHYLTEYLYVRQGQCCVL